MNNTNESILTEKAIDAFSTFYPFIPDNNSNLFDQAFSLSSLYNSLDQCIVGTIWKESVMNYYLYRDYYLNWLHCALYSGNFNFSPLFHTKITEHGKERLVCSLTIQDRIVQKSINQRILLPTFRNKLIYDNCASLKCRGVDFAINRLYAHMQKAYENFNSNFYIAKLDIHHYFDSISHNYILSIIDRYIKEPRIVDLISRILYQYRQDSWIHNGENVPFGIGLGGEIPQSFGIICLNELDHIIKEQLHIPYMVRYMDDIVLIHQDRDYLVKCLNYISEYLYTIGLILNKNKTTIVPAKEGILFLKFHFYLGNNIREIYIKPNKKSIKNEKRKLIKMVELFKEGYIILPSDIKQSYDSWKGHIQRADSYIEQIIMDQLFENILTNYIIEDTIINRAIDRYKNGTKYPKRKPTRNNICTGNLDKKIS